MRKIIYLFILFLSLTSNLFGQEQRSSSSDSSFLNIDQLLQTDDHDDLQRLNNDAQKVLDKKDSLINDLNRARDLNVQTIPKTKSDSVKHRLQFIADSLKTLTITDSSFIADLQQVQFTLDSITDVKNHAAYQKGEEYLTKLEAKVSKLQEKVKSQTSSLASLSGPAGAMPQVPSLPSSDVNIGEALPEQLNFKNDILPSEINNKQLSLPEIEVTDVAKLEEVDNLADNITKAGDVTDKAASYNEDFNNLAKGNAEGISLVSEELNADGFKDMQEQVDLADQMKRYADPEVAKEEMLNHAKETAVNHFAGHEEELKAAVEQFQKVKSKIPKPEGVIDLMDRRKTSLKYKSFNARTYFGVTFQFQKPGSFWLDINPHFSYQINGRFTAGIGWNERLAYHFKENSFKWNERIYGPRTFLLFELKENLRLKADVEYMNIASSTKYQPTETNISTRGDWSYFGGIQKDFKISNALSGNLQILYNFFDKDRKSPYAERINIRMGFDLIGEK